MKLHTILALLIGLTVSFKLGAQPFKEVTVDMMIETAEASRKSGLLYRPGGGKCL
jgi:hypothetical protein